MDAAAAAAAAAGPDMPAGPPEKAKFEYRISIFDEDVGLFEAYILSQKMLYETHSEPWKWLSYLLEPHIHVGTHAPLPERVAGFPYRTYSIFITQEVRLGEIPSVVGRQPLVAFLIRENWCYHAARLYVMPIYRMAGHAKNLLKKAEISGAESLPEAISFWMKFAIEHNKCWKKVYVVSEACVGDKSPCHACTLRLMKKWLPTIEHLIKCEEAHDNLCEYAQLHQELGPYTIFFYTYRLKYGLDKTFGAFDVFQLRCAKLGLQAIKAEDVEEELYVSSDEESDDSSW